jgi:hypothetical protein
MSKSHCNWRSVSLSWCRVTRLCQSHTATDGRSVCLSWCRAPSGTHDQIFLPVWKLLSCPRGAPSLTRGQVCRLSESQSAVLCQLPVYIIIYILLITNFLYIQYIRGLCQSRISTEDYALFLVASATTDEAIKNSAYFYWGWGRDSKKSRLLERHFGSRRSSLPQKTFQCKFNGISTIVQLRTNIIKKVKLSLLQAMEAHRVVRR